jgi:predicted nucleic acid-binding protein
VRVSSNPSFTPEAVTPAEAIGLLNRVARMPGHDFWPDDICLKDAVRSAAGVIGHRQVVDIYLLAVAAAHGGMLATLDRGAAALAHAQQHPVELIG